MTQYEVSNLVNDLDLFKEQQGSILSQNTLVTRMDVNLTDYILKYDNKKVKEALRLIDVAEKLNRNTRGLVSDWKEKYVHHVRDEADKAYDTMINLLFYVLEDAIEIDWDGYELEVNDLNNLRRQEQQDYDEARKERY